MSITFTARPNGKFSGPGFTARCVLGKGGVVVAGQKREGDGASPAGRWPIRRVFYRPDRGDPPKTSLEKVPLTPDDGWCDEANHPLYNLFVSLPFIHSHEKLWRDDHVYDLIVELGYNDDPVVPGRGSAIFMHIAQPDFRPTEGCIAMEKEDLLAALEMMTPDTLIEISF
ncbi:hypothetical protein HY29_14505 [Hyphomonas beringensis]|uniref:L,D-TPase catalytic domain-containing protein n=1 Tax=Hyphomonas beringensis TaxID=1280946 RepID=A0A062U9D8_9PROT|nr:L,D-transpeptidase family protein [Hyphomonas beringensis]KCZ54358.1 hypothetical protein HY29_14505 [Hyphomonas beringensis]